MQHVDLERLTMALRRLSDIKAQKRVWLAIGQDLTRPGYEMSSLEKDAAQVYIDSGFHNFCRSGRTAISPEVDTKIKELLLIAESEELYHRVNDEAALGLPGMVRLRGLAHEILEEITRKN